MKIKDFIFIYVKLNSNYYDFNINILDIMYRIKEKKNENNTFTIFIDLLNIKKLTQRDYNHLVFLQNIYRKGWYYK